VQLARPEYRKHQRNDILVFIFQQAGLGETIERERRPRESAFDKRQARHFGQRELAGNDLMNGPADLDDIVLHALVHIAEIGEGRSVADIDLNGPTALAG
jgi:hypothetical protein